MAKEFTHEPDANRYAVHIDGELAGVLDYSVLGSAISMRRAYTAPHFRGHGLAAELVSFAVDDVEANTDYRIVPMCWYVAEWFDKHPERSGLLSQRASA